MPPLFQFEIAVALAASTLCSLVVLFFTRSKEGKLRLPTGTEEPTFHSFDPFDVITSEDIIDGYPIDGEKFWRHIRWRKLLMLFFHCVTVIINVVVLAWSVSGGMRREIEIYCMQLYFALYLLGLSARSASQNTTNSHAKLSIHLTALITLAAALLCYSVILPATPSPIALAVESVRPFQELWFATMSIYVVLSITSLTMPLGPRLHFPMERLYSAKTISVTTNVDEENVSGIVGASVWSLLIFSYMTKAIWLCNLAASVEVGDLPIVPANLRATYNYFWMKRATRDIKLHIFSWTPQPGSGWELGYRLMRLNALVFTAEALLAGVSAMLFYAPAFFLQQFVAYLEVDPKREHIRWGWAYVFGLFTSHIILYLVTGQLWSLTTITIQVRLKTQLNTILFAKTLVRKDVASSAPPPSTVDKTVTEETPTHDENDEESFSSKSQVMTLMTTDVDRIGNFPMNVFGVISAPIEFTVGSLLLYNLLGVSSFFGLGVTCLFLPINHYAGKVVVSAQSNLMKARDERVGLMNEVLAGIRMLKFMAWERSFEAKILKIREKELKYQKLNYLMQIFWTFLWGSSPILVTLVSFWHFAVFRQQVLSPSVAFTSIMILTELKYSLNSLPETFINILQTLVSLRRIEKYLNGPEVSPVQPMSHQSQTIAFQSCTVTWPQDRSKAQSAASTPRNKFVLVDLTLNFPAGKLSLICGKLGSGKSLLLLALLGEADILAGQMTSPRSPPDSIASLERIAGSLTQEQWIIEGMCAYVPQTAWLRNESIRDNILFSLPYNETRYRRTLEVCALINDLEILEDGDESEIGERGVNLSGGQKARVSLARAVYSRASILLLDDVLSAVDAHTAHHLYNECLNGDLMHGRTIILVSHHVQLCLPRAAYVVALENGRVEFEGPRDVFQTSEAMSRLVQSKETDVSDDKEDVISLPDAEQLLLEVGDTGPSSETSSTAASSPPDVKVEKKVPRKVVEDEKRAVGRISRDVWESYIKACGNGWYWGTFFAIMVAAALSPVIENGWIRKWSDADDSNPVFYLTAYAIITTVGLVFTTIRWFVLYSGSITASRVLYKRLLEAVLFAHIRFHDTSSRGRLLNRFGKDFEGIDSSLSVDFGSSIVFGLSTLTSVITICIIGGLPVVIAAVPVIAVYYKVSKLFGQISRDMRRLNSITRSPLYSIYGETISGVTVIRAFGASSKFLRDMLCCVDTNTNPYYWLWGVARWLASRFNWVSGSIFGAMAAVILLTPSINAALAGFTLTFSYTITIDLFYFVRRFVMLEQSMVALERVKEYSDLAQEPPEFIEPRPPSTWPARGAIQCQNLVIRYAPELPNVLHNLNFDILPGEKVGILGRTGSGKSTLALSFFRFVEATEGRIIVDGLDIANIGLTDLRSKLTIIPQDPTILSGSLRSTLDVFDEYEDAEIFEALRRVHLIPSEDTPGEAADLVNANVFRDLDSSVSEGGENFSTGEKQLLCMARAILKRSKVLVMDEATASVDYATDELIGKTIRQEFAESTILTIAHRLRTVIDYDRIMLLDQGRIAEFARPADLLRDTNSKFYSLCKATGKEEFAMLKKMAGTS